MKKFGVNLQRKEKIINITLSGFLSDEDGQEFLKEYLANIKNINAKEYTLIVNIENLSTTSADLVPNIEQSFKLYMSSHFKKIIYIKPKNIVSKSQLMRISRNVNMVADFVDSMQEAMKIA